MNNDDLLLDALLDDELDAATSLALQRRFAAEPALQRRVEARRALRDAVRGQATRHAAPAALRASLAAGAGVTRERASALRFALPWVTAIGGALVATLVTLLAVDRAALGLRPPDALSAQQVAEASEAVSAHTRALLVEHPIEVASADQHTVRPWLSARLNFVPPVVDLAAQGYPLLGARRDVLSGQTAAALVYRHGAHVISVFVRPAEPGLAAGAAATRVVRGFNVVERTQGGMALCFVSDLNPTELVALADLLAPLPM
ncbi:MAG: anti-sigma factor [Betaproteobacteria bacterium]